MMTMTRDDEHEYYAEPENQQPQGPPRRRKTSAAPADQRADSADRTSPNDA